MIGRRAAAAGIGTKLGNHSFRATGITAYLKNGGSLERPRRWQTALRRARRNSTIAVATNSRSMRSSELEFDLCVGAGEAKTRRAFGYNLCNRNRKRNQRLN